MAGCAGLSAFSDFRRKEGRAHLRVRTPWSGLLEVIIARKRSGKTSRHEEFPFGPFPLPGRASSLRVEVSDRTAKKRRRKFQKPPPPSCQPAIHQRSWVLVLKMMAGSNHRFYRRFWAIWCLELRSSDISGGLDAPRTFWAKSSGPMWVIRRNTDSLEFGIETMNEEEGDSVPAPALLLGRAQRRAGFAPGGKGADP